MSQALLKRIGRRAPNWMIPPGLNFYAPLQGDTRDLLGAPVIFDRNGNSNYRAGLDYEIATTDEAVFEEGAYRHLPARTNKCTNYNANPDAGLSNITGGSGYLSRVANAQALLDAGLQKLCTDGNVFEVDNQSGGDLYVTIQGATGNTNDHAVSWWVNSFGDDVRFTVSGSPWTIVNSSELTYYSAVKTPLASNRAFQIWISNGTKIQWVLNQMEEGLEATAPIVTAGASASRAVDALKWRNGSSPVPITTNGQLDNSCSGWTAPAGCADTTVLSSGIRIDNYTGSDCVIIRQDGLGIEQYKWYRISVDVSEYSETQGYLSVLAAGTQAGVIDLADGVGRHQFFYFRDAAVVTDRIQINAAGSPSGFTAQIDEITVEEYEPFFVQSEGVMMVTAKMLFDSAGRAAFNQAILTVDNSVLGPIYLSNDRFKSYDNTNNPNAVFTSFVEDDEFKIALRWSGSGFQLGFSKNGAAWVWGTEVAYDGDFVYDGYMYLNYSSSFPMRLSGLWVCSEVKTTAWIESNY